MLAGGWFLLNAVTRKWHIAWRYGSKFSKQIRNSKFLLLPITFEEE